MTFGRLGTTFSFGFVKEAILGWAYGGLAVLFYPTSHAFIVAIPTQSKVLEDPFSQFF